MIFRELKENETGLLKTFLYEAIFIPEGVELPPYDIVEQPELRLSKRQITPFGCMRRSAFGQKMRMKKSTLWSVNYENVIF